MTASRVYSPIWDPTSSPPPPPAAAAVGPGVGVVARGAVGVGGAVTSQVGEGHQVGIANQFNVVVVVGSRGNHEVGTADGARRTVAGLDASALDDLAINWHFIGPIQSNKTRSITELFSWVHSVDRLKIARRLSEQRNPSGPALNVCVQVNLSGEASCEDGSA